MLEKAAKFSYSVRSMSMRMNNILLSLVVLCTHISNSKLVSGNFLSSLCLPRSNVVEIDEIDRMYMRRAISLAAQGSGRTSPNPCVGCVIVNNGTVVGEGWHRQAGTAHAEANALLIAGAKAAGATAYVSLEPCNHYGRTPPCSHSLLRHGVSRVVAGMVDPDPRVSGYGLQYLRDNNVVVNVADREEAALCRNLNAPFVFRVLTDRAYCILLTSVSDDGHICNPVRRPCDVLTPLSHTAVELDLSAVLAELAPETNAVVLTVTQLLDISPSILAALPQHVSIAVNVPRKDLEALTDIAQVKAAVAVIRSMSSEENMNRRWMILSPGGDSDSASPLRSISCESCLVSPADVEKIDDIEMHYYDSDAAKSSDMEVKIAGTVDLSSSSSPSSESQQLLAVVKQMAMLGFNAVMLLADSAKRFELLQSSDTCQKLLMTMQHHHLSSEAAHSLDSDSEGAAQILAERDTDQNSSSSDDDNNSEMFGVYDVSDIHKDAVNSVLSSMSQHSIQSSYIGGEGFREDGSSSSSLVDPVTMDPGSVSSTNGHFHIMGQTSTSTSTPTSIDSALDSDSDISQVDVSGIHEVITGTDTTHRTLRKNRKKSSNPLRVFSIRFWS